ncbi:MAG: DUF427 domain-containing protein [Oxalobacteraceae bacterium]|nr:MAG: DUF427 domain-containing protein [Oxalobacteraceae bacterium]
MRETRIDPAQPGQESVWEYPRPAIAQPSSARILVELSNIVIADSCRAVRTIETSHPPSYYIPPADIMPGVLVAAEGSSYCEWKGHARYFDVIAGSERRERAAWSYPNPTAGFLSLKDHVAFYAAAMDACFVDGERVIPQPGGFYGGWITSAVAGPFKGVPGSRFW